jgi:hypothetical protein
VVLWSWFSSRLFSVSLCVVAASGHFRSETHETQKDALMPLGRSNAFQGSMIVIRFHATMGQIMARPRVASEERREKVSISPDRRVLDWIDLRVGMGRPFASRTHAFEYAVVQLMEAEGEKPKQR